MKIEKHKFRQFIAAYIATFLVLLAGSYLKMPIGGYGLVILPALNALAWTIGINAGNKKR